MAKRLTVGDLGEKRLIREIILPICGTPVTGLGIGDDAAMIDLPAGTSLLVSTDKIPEDLLALQLDLMSPFEHGRYLAQVNISDVAAMGGLPLGLLSNLAMPNNFSLEYLKQFFQGFVSGGAEMDVPVIGGDIGWGSAPCFTATVIGCVEKERVLTRSGASVGDRVFVSGPVGGFGTALAYFAVAKKEGFCISEDYERYLVERLVHPTAKTKISRLLAESGICTSCMDITDGFRQTVIELTEASGVGFAIDEDRLPIHPVTLEVAEFLNIAPAEIVFGIGLDLELAGTLSCRENPSPPEIADKVTIIGTVSDDNENVLRLKSGETISLPGIGWQHFVGDAMNLVKEAYDPKNKLRVVFEED